MIRLNSEKLNKISSIAALFCCFFLLYALKMHAQTETGVTVNGYHLGAHADSLDFHGLQRMGKFQKLIRWDVTGESIMMDGVPLKFCRLFFWENKLHSIELKASGPSGDELRLWIESVFGAGEKTDNMGYRYQWMLPTIRILWDQNLATKDGMATFTAEAVHRSYYKFMYNRANGRR